MKAITAWLLIFLSVPAFAQSVEVNDSEEANPPIQAAPGSGKGKAQQYFQSRKKDAQGNSASTELGAAPHFLAIHVGGFFQDQSYRWGNNDKDGNSGRFNGGVTYRMGEWINSADFLIRSEYSSYTLDEGNARKLDFLAMVMFPDVNSRFPLYFGAGIGPGFFLKQLHGQSAMSLDYQLVAGARFFNVIDNLGFFAEFGLKNAIHLFSVGQYNGLFAGVGTAWLF